MMVKSANTLTHNVNVAAWYMHVHLQVSGCMSLKSALVQPMEMPPTLEVHLCTPPAVHAES